MRTGLTTKCIAQLGLLVALSALVQSLRLLLPLPPMITLLVIGIILNSCIIYAFELASLQGAILVGVIVPLIALLQQAFLSPVLILPAIIANIMYAWCYAGLAKKQSLWLQLLAPAAVRAFVLYMISMLLFKGFGFSDEQIIWLQGWICIAQFLTGISGIYLCKKFIVKIRVN